MERKTEMKKEKQIQNKTASYLLSSQKKKRRDVLTYTVLYFVLNFLSSFYLSFFLRYFSAERGEIRRMKTRSSGKN
jgi:hypothetical protein